MAAPRDDTKRWLAVRCFFDVGVAKDESQIYEERVTLWWADGFHEAVALAEDEARDYAATLDVGYLGLAQCYDLGETEVGSGTEVFSLMRDSTLDPDEYLNAFFDTGTERQRDF